MVKLLMYMYMYTWKGFLTLIETRLQVRLLIRPSCFVLIYICYPNLLMLVCPLRSTCITCTFVPVSMQKEERERVGGEGRRERGEGMVM